MNQNSDILSHVRLQFNVQCSSLEDCYLAGFEASKADLTDEGNPYPQNSSEFVQWSEGWSDGFFGVEPLFTLAGDTEFTTLTKSHIDDVRMAPAANEAFWKNPKVRLWARRTLQVAGALAASLAVYELMDLAM